ncbi:hypothetical protein [Desulfobotulus sp.]|jgi:hypothetical protein|uniref:hypothetical protein n=1 Tax=Desulfobotulus sp. TaxID=1940337 RepID=UPI002A3642F6|nr:hypothetical protein [Desulfobotulus sp.]MDY0163527.1 hypothetical protein [Desulfobotulus sp.]
MASYAHKDGKLDTKDIAATHLPDTTIASGKEYAWSTISHWYSKQDLFQSSPCIYDIGRSENFFLALIFAEILEPEFSSDAMADLRGGSVVVRLYSPDTDNPVYYKVQKTLLYTKELPEKRHKSYWIFMLEKAFVFHCRESLPELKTATYLDALKKISFRDALSLLVGKTKAQEMMGFGTDAGRKIKEKNAWTDKDRSQAAVKAIEKLSDLKLFNDYAARAICLIADPVSLDQDQFGVCGQASVIFVLLSFQPQRFTALLRAIFNNEVFVGGISKIKAPVKIQPGQAEYKTIMKSVAEAPLSSESETTDINALLAGRMKQYTKKAAENPKIKPHTKLDFIISRTLAKMLKIINPGLYEDQKKYTEKFLVKGQPLGVKHGDLAFTENGVQLLLTDIIGAEELYFIPSMTEPGPMINALNKWFREKKDNGPFAIAAVNGLSWIHQNSTAPSTIWDPSKQNYDFAHWVVIVGEIRDQGWYCIPIWTWAHMFKSCKLAKGKTEGYLYSVILGCLKSE